MSSYTCPNSETCPIYQNWVSQTNDKRLDIIQKPLKMSPFSCLAYEALKDEETGISIGKLEGRTIGDNCAFILDLNLKSLV